MWRASAAMDGHAIEISPTSLHGRVTSDLLARIQSGQLAPGKAMPTETELCREYGVSRITIRRALSVLVDRRLVVRRRGIGSFVTGRPAELREFHLIGFLDEKLAFAHDMLLNVVEQADGRIADALELEAGSRVQHIRTVVHADGDPFTVIDAYSADTLDRRMAEADFVVPVPSANAMGERLGRRIARAEQELDAVAADKVAAAALRVPAGTPIIRARRVYYAAGDQPIQYLIVRYHPGHYRFIVDLIPRGGTSAFTAMPQLAGTDKKPRKGKR